MNVKIIRRAEREKFTQQIPVVSQTKTGDAQTAVATTVKFWIDELRQKRENERQAVKTLFG